MAGKPSASMVHAMRLILDASLTPYKAAKMANVSTSTMYRSRLYKLWQAGKHADLRRELDQTMPKGRVKAK